MLWLVRSAIVALFPRTDLPGAADCGLDAFLVKYRRESTLLLWLGAIAGALVFHLTPVLTVYVPLPAFLLPRALLEKHAQRITTTRFYLLRQAVFLVKLVGGLCWGAHPEVRRRFMLQPLKPDPGTWRTS